MNEDFYKTKRWRHLRALILRRDGYMCQINRRYGKTVQADTVHHIFPRELFPEYQWEPWNLISISSDVHNKLHKRNSNELTRQGADLLRKTAIKRGIILDDERLTGTPP